LGKIKGAKGSEKLWLLPSRFVLRVDSVSATLCDISAVGFNAINDACLARVYANSKDTFVYGFADSFDECIKQSQVTN